MFLMTMPITPSQHSQWLRAVGVVVLTCLVATRLADIILMVTAWRRCFTVVLVQMFLDYNSQKPLPLAMLARISGSCSSRTSGDPRFGATALEASE